MTTTKTKLTRKNYRWGDPPNKVVFEIRVTKDQLRKLMKNRLGEELRFRIQNCDGVSICITSKDETWLCFNASWAQHWHKVADLVGKRAKKLDEFLEAL